jgi:hypothetical protein
LSGNLFLKLAAPLLGGFLLCALLLGSAMAQVPVLAGKAWNSLSRPQQQVLEPLASQWQQMDAASRDTWAALAARYPQLGPVEQQRLQERMAAWAALTPLERQRVHQGFVAAQRHAANERQQKWEQYQALPTEAKQLLQERGARRLADAPLTALTPKPATPVATFANPEARKPLSGAPAQLDANTLLPLRTPQP